MGTIELGLLESVEGHDLLHKASIGAGPIEPEPVFSALDPGAGPAPPCGARHRQAPATGPACAEAAVRTRARRPGWGRRPGR
jgi:hypothetical protein